MLFSGNKEKKTITLVSRQVQIVGFIVDVFDKLLRPDVEMVHCDKEVLKIEGYRNELKKVQKQAEDILHQGAFFPVYRGDYFLFMDRIQDISRTCINITYEFKNIPVVLLNTLFSEISNINRVVAEAVRALAKMFQVLHNKHKQAIKIAG